MTARHRLVRVPASSANLGPGYDALAAAMALHLELEVEESDGFSFDDGGLGVPTGRDNLIVRAFESLRPADGIAFRLRSEIPLARGLGSSAAAIVAGLAAADHLYELALTKEELLARATEIAGHPDNVAAAAGRRSGASRSARWASTFRSCKRGRGAAAQPVRPGPRFTVWKIPVHRLPVLALCTESNGVETPYVQWVSVREQGASTPQAKGPEPRARCRNATAHR